MRSVLLAPLLVAPVLAQTVNQTVLTQLAGALTSAGLTSLASIAAQIANTTVGSQLLASITNTTANLTIFAPSNAAFAKVPKNISSDPDTLAAILSYHVVSGPFLNASFFFDSPNNTILSTFLNSTDDVHLQGNASQVIAATVKSGKITILNQNPTITVTNSTNFSNIDILFIDGLLSPPANISTVLMDSGLDAFISALQLAGLTDAVNNAHGVTIFAPTDAALAKALATFGAQAQNTTLIQTVLQNHIINGTSVYSSQFSKSATSAAGESLTFNITGNSTSLSSGSSGNFTANITTKDILAANGVIHIIDNVLANSQSDASAASSAFQSATSQAANPTTASGPVGATPSTSPGKNSGSAVSISAGAILAIAFSAALGACTL